MTQEEGGPRYVEFGKAFGALIIWLFTVTASGGFAIGMLYNRVSAEERNETELRASLMELRTRGSDALIGHTTHDTEMERRIKVLEDGGNPADLARRIGALEIGQNVQNDRLNAIDQKLAVLISRFPGNGAR